MKEKEMKKENEPNTIMYQTFRPGGNDTALVMRPEPDAQKRKLINDLLMKSKPNIEQVGFLDIENRSLQLAGDEFCVNAGRSSTWVILGGQPGEILLQVSGAEKRLRAGVTRNGEAWMQMPILPSPDNIVEVGDYQIVTMQGITHVVYRVAEVEQDAELLKQKAFAILQRFGLTTSVPAAGVIFTTQNGDSLKIDPVVWVRDIQTLFYETACGSGTGALGMVEALRLKRPVRLVVRQPSGKDIKINISSDGRKFSSAVVSGPIEKLTEVETLEMNI